MKPKIAIAVSGGVDSLVAAYLLKKQYKDIIGIHFLTGYEQSSIRNPQSSAEFSLAPNESITKAPYDSHLISHISNQLDIPIQLVDCRRLFKKKVVDYFVSDYLNGMTPNPCMICNQTIKFGIILDIALKMGASGLATGHYAKIEKDSNRYKLKKGIDTIKEQSYFLALLQTAKLPYIQFPLGNLTKQQVKEIASVNKLTPVTQKESQDVCFIKNNNYVQFISSHAEFNAQPGPINDLNGLTLGSHNGLHNYTIGQRRGINCPASAPYYVLKIDTKQNRLIVGFKKDLYKTNCLIKCINWLIPRPESQIHISVKIRYRHQAVDAILVPEQDGSAIIYFKKPQAAITPGQAAVCYQGDEVIAAGWIYEQRK